MDEHLVIFMVTTSILMGFIGVLFFINGIKKGHFDDEVKFTNLIMYDNNEELNAIIKRENKKNGENMRKEVDLIIIGAGPAGVAAAVEAKHSGLNAVLFEKGKEISNLMREYYKDGKPIDKDYKGQVTDLRGNIPFADTNKEECLKYMDKLLEGNTVDIRKSAEIPKVKKDGDLFLAMNGDEEIVAKYAIISIGKMGKPNKPAYKLPSSLKKVINFTANEAQAGDNVLVVGGGDSAVEYAYMLSDNCKVTLTYRQDKIFRANPKNIAIVEDYAKNGKLTTKLGVDIQELEDADGKVKVKFADGSAEVYDRVVYALGGSSPTDFLITAGVELDEKGVPKLKDNYETNVPNLYISGDLGFKNGCSISLSFNMSFDIINTIKSK